MVRSVRLTSVCLVALSSVLLSACQPSDHLNASASTTAATQAAGTSAAATTEPPAASSAAAQQPAAATSSRPAAAASASAPATAGGLAEKGCTALKTSDVQALVTGSPKVDYVPGSAELDPTHSFVCDIDNPDIVINVHPEDTGQQQYKTDVAGENVPAVTLSGVGDAAVWAAVSLTPGFYTAPPDVYAYKDSVTCEITGSGSGLTIPVQPGVAASYAQTDEAAFAAKLGVLCTDIFGAIS